MSVFDELEKIKKVGLPQILVLYGEEENIVQELKDRLLEFVHYDSSDLGQAYFDLNTSNANLALEELESLPFFVEQKLVILENLSNLTTAKKSVLDEKQTSRFENFLNNPVESTQLILILHGKLDSRLKLTKKLKSVATLLEAQELKPQELSRAFAETGLSNTILQRIFEKSNFTFPIIKQNISLLKTYTGEREITLEDVEKVVPKSLQDNIFLLTDLILKGKVADARDLVHDLTLQGEELIKILVIMTNTFRLYYQVKLMQNKGWDEQKQTTYLKIHPYRVKLANQQVRKMQEDFLAQALLSLIELDYKIKSSGVDANYLFDLAVIKLALKDL
ncbi:DNA polymerase III subunit delta [Lactococcus garvieae]|jgi:DNA polymerase-3 subunit delta|uniref:DNA polymerase III subunit delta n=1 Tax=Lactococcus garvieae DCC43 TaxID=1231377 RepID=K2QE40_9LACT|nr:DNA polymerase III subunit delta [Lactococcus garvieae]EKF51662.1 DNA polymerase III delta subunit [Lactococcus garvieae DCC43]